MSFSKIPKAPKKSKNPNPIKLVKVPRLNLESICPNAPTKSKNSNPLNYTSEIPKFVLGTGNDSGEESPMWENDENDEDEYPHTYKNIKSISYLPSKTNKPNITIIYY
jgi:hypothetical protein